jgi:mRNA interferase RelE/StbE
MAWRWLIVESASRDLKKLDRRIAERIAKKLDFWMESGEPLRFAENLTNSELGEYRFRVGNYRIIFEVDGENVVILAVGHRREIYK